MPRSPLTVTCTTREPVAACVWAVGYPTGMVNRRGIRSASVTAVLVWSLAGGLAGALVPRVAYRLSVPYGAPPRSACAGCARPFPPGPSGWVRVTARCPGCRRRLGPPGWLTAPVGALACGLLAWALADVEPPVLGAFLVVAGIGVLLAVIDVSCLRLPDPLVATAGLAAFVLLGAAALGAGEVGPLLRGLAGSVLMGAAYLLLALLPGANLGFGDVKLAAVLGLLLGWLGWGAVLLGALLPHLINGPVALALLVSRRASRKTELPLGPALLAGALAAVVVAAVLHR